MKSNLQTSDEMFKSWPTRTAPAFTTYLMVISARRRSASVPTAAPNKLKAILECLDYMLAKRGSHSGITDTVRKMILKCPEMRLAEAGY